jgi:hypothetical protein
MAEFEIVSVSKKFSKKSPSANAQQRTTNRIAEIAVKT